AKGFGPGAPPRRPPATARELLLLRIQRLRDPHAVAVDGATVDVSLLFGLAVPVVAEPETCGSKAGETLVLLGADGNRANGFAAELGDPAAVAKALVPELLGETALARRRANVPPELQRLADEYRELTLRPPADQAGVERMSKLHEQLSARLYAA